MPPVPDDRLFAAELIKAVWSLYCDHTAAQLSNLTHARGTPWDEIQKKGRWYAEIPDELIAQHYRDKLRAVGAEI